MGDIKVNFLGEEYLFPIEIQEYIVYCKMFQDVYNRLFSVITKRIEEKWYDFPDKEFEKILKQEGENIISSLSTDGIYDVSLNELVNRNRGYIYFEKITMECFGDYKQIMIDAIMDFKTGYENAQAQANSEITGSGMTLYSNSAIQHLAFAAFESNTIKKQIAKAETEYENSISELSRRNQSIKDRRENALLYNKVYPAYFEVIGMFVSELTDIYLNILEKHSVYNYSKIKAYKTERSNELLENIGLVNDKEKILIEAFRNCPYNPNVYKKIIDMELFDYDTFMTAREFGQADSLIEDLEKYCKGHTNEYEKLSVPVKILAAFKNTREVLILRNLYSHEISSIEEKYRLIQNALSDNSVLTKWVKNNITPSTENLLCMDMRTISVAVEKQIYSIISKVAFDDFCSKRLLNLGLFNKEKDYVSMNNAIIKQMNDRIFVYIKNAEVRKEKYDLAKSRFDNEVNRRKASIDQRKAEKKSIGFFAFSKKKEINNIIQGLENELSEYMRGNDPTPLLLEFENMFE